MVASYAHYAVVLQSILVGADLDIQQNNGRTALTIASEKGHKAVATLLILARMSTPKIIMATQHR